MFDPTAWNNASTELEPDSPPPPGLYEVAIETAEIFQSKAGDDFIRMGYKVVVGPLTDHEWSEIRGFSERAVPVTKAHCKALGVDVDKITSLEGLDQALRAVVGGYATVKVKKNGQYTNTSVEARHSGPVGSDVPTDDPEPTGPPAGSVDENGDEIPF